MKCEVVKTRGGASAIRDTARGEVMHPGEGPEIEAATLYTSPSRLSERLSAGRDDMPPLVLFDIGLGAASNAIGAWKISAALPANARQLAIISFENDLTPLKLALSEEHRGAFGFADSAAHAAADHLMRHGEHSTPRTTWHLRFGDLMDGLKNEAHMADIVFWDPYSPKSDPHLWGVSAFARLHGRCTQSATVHTYSAATPTRAAMLLGGFFVGIGGATGGKSETTIAATRLDDLREPLGKRWLERLRRSSAPLPNDILGGANSRASVLARIERLPQFQT